MNIRKNIYTIFRTTKTKHTKKKEENSMIITLISIVILVVGAIMLSIELKKQFPSEAGLEFKTNVFFAGLAFTLICFGLIISNHRTYDSLVENEKEYALLNANVRLIETNADELPVDVIIERAKEWNHKVEEARKWTANPWTSWFYDKTVTDEMELIELPKRNGSD